MIMTNVEVDVDDVMLDVIEEADDDVLLDECVKRRLITRPSANEDGFRFVDLNNVEAHRYLCDLVNVGYNVSLDELCTILKARCDGWK